MNILVITNTVLSGFLTLVMALFYFSHRTYSGFLQWTMGGCLIALAFLMVVLRGRVPNSLAIVIQNLAYPLAAVLYLAGMRSFLGLSEMSRGWCVVPAVSALFSVFSLYFFDSAAWRTLMVALAFSAPHMATAILILKDYFRNKSFFSLVLAGEMALASALLLVWALWSFTIADFQLLMVTPVHAGFFISLMVLQIVITLSFLMLNVERANRDLVSAQDALKYSEEKYSKAFHSTPDAILITRLVDGKLVEVNESFSAISGYSRDEALASSSMALSLWQKPEDREKVANLLRDHKRIRDEEVRFRTKSGEIVNCLFSGETILLNGEAHVLSVVRDVSERTRWEQELETTLQRFYAVLASANTGMLLVTKENTVEFVNQAMCDMFSLQDPPNSFRGLSSKEIIGRLKGVYAHPEEILERIKEAVSQNQPIKGEEVKTRDGRGFLVDYIPIDIDGDPYGRLWLHTDITQLQRTQQTLRESEERLELALTGADLGTWDVDVRTGQGIISKRSAEIIGYTSDEMAPTLDVWRSLIHPDDKFRVVESLQRRLRGLDGFVDNEYRIQTKSGGYVWVLSRGKVVRKDENGRPLRIAGTFMEITARKRAEEALKESEQRFRRLFEGHHAVMLLIDPDSGAIVDANSASAHYYGYTRDELCMMAIQDINCLSPDEVYAERQRAKHEHHNYFVFPHRLANGEIRTVEVHSSPIEIGNQTLLFSIIHDISDRVQVEQEKKALQSQLVQSQKMEAIGSLATGVAHDFNNMLTVIMGNSSFLLNEMKEGDPRRRRLQAILKTSQTAAELVQRILAFSGRAAVKPVLIDLNSQINEVMKILSHTLPRTIDMHTQLSGKLELIKADKSMMSQVVMNLGINGAEAMPQGGKLTIQTENAVLDDEYCRMHTGVKPGRYVLLMVSDTGRGIDKALIDRIFDPFFSTKPKGATKGTGLGLSMVQGILAQHQGHITVQSEVGEGTTFRIYLPAIEEEPVPAVVETRTELPIGGNETILLVEDEEMVRELGEAILQRFGYTVLTAVDGVEALDVYRKEQEKIALVILDIVMPRMEGKECLEELLKINPQVKVIVSSGLDPLGLVKDLVGLGAKDAVNKPFSMREMLETVRGVIDAE